MISRLLSRLRGLSQARGALTIARTSASPYATVSATTSRFSPQKILGYSLATGAGVAGFGFLGGFGLKELSSGIRRLTGDPIEEAKQMMELKQKELEIDKQYWNQLKEYMQMIQQMQGTAGNMKNPTTIPEWSFSIPGIEPLKEIFTPNVPQPQTTQSFNWLPVILLAGGLVLVVYLLTRRGK